MSEFKAITITATGPDLARIVERAEVYAIENNARVGYGRTVTVNPPEKLPRTLSKPVIRWLLDAEGQPQMPPLLTVGDMPAFEEGTNPPSIRRTLHARTLARKLGLGVVEVYPVPVNRGRYTHTITGNFGVGTIKADTYRLLRADRVDDVVVDALDPASNLKLSDPTFEFVQRLAAAVDIADLRPPIEHNDGNVLYPIDLALGR